MSLPTEQTQPSPQELGGQAQPRLFDVSKELYEGGKAVEGDLASYVTKAQELGVFNSPRLELTGGTGMWVHGAIAAKAGASSEIAGFAFNNPGREGVLELYSAEIASLAPEVPAKSLLVENMPPSNLVGEAPVLDVRLLFRDEVEGPGNLDPRHSVEVAKQLIAEFRTLKKDGVDRVRITGFPLWLGGDTAAFIAVREGSMKQVTMSAPAGEILVYDEEHPDQVGTTDYPPVKVVEYSTDQMDGLTPEDVKDWRSLATHGLSSVEFAEDDPRKVVAINEVVLTPGEKKVDPAVALRVFDSLHGGQAKRVGMVGVEIFSHKPGVRDLVLKDKGLPGEQREAVTQDVHAALEAAEGDPEKAALTLATEAVNKASELTFTGITTPQELAVAGKVAHAAHGLIQELRYQDAPDAQPQVIKSWKATA